MKKALAIAAVLLISGIGFANATPVTLTEVAAPSTFNLTAVGTADWVMPHYDEVGASLGLARMGTGATAVNILQYWGNGPLAPRPLQSPTSVSWTNGTNSEPSNAGTTRATQSNQYNSVQALVADLQNSANPSGTSAVTVTFTAATQNNSIVYAWLETGSAADHNNAATHFGPEGPTLQTFQMAANTWYMFTATFTGTAGQCLNLWVGGIPHSSVPLFGAAALSVGATPEPATMTLLVIGGIGALLKRRRNA